MDIYCPKCEWEPPAGAQWTCECGKVWREAQCHQWSPHHDWYHDLLPVDVEELAEGEETA